MSIVDIDAPADGADLPKRVAPLPIIGIQCCRREIATQYSTHPVHAVVKKYVDAVVDGTGGMPLLVPAEEADAATAAAIAARLDGLLVPGSPSNVEPYHYDGPASQPKTLHDPARDAMALPLLRAAVMADLPVLAICRGIQELNVALGGSLHQRVHEVPGRLDHRAPRQGTVEERYAFRAHSIALTAGGILERVAGASTLMVNSLHQQGIDRVAASLRVEGLAPDGQIEAVSAPEARFVVGVQWHPEFRFAEDPFSVRLFAAFGEACRARATARIAPR